MIFLSFCSTASKWLYKHRIVSANLHLAEFTFQSPPACVKDDLGFGINFVCALMELFGRKLLSLLLLLSLGVKSARLVLQEPECSSLGLLEMAEFAFLD